MSQVGRKSSHSMRRTGVTLLMDANIPLTRICELGRWSNTQCLERVYCRGRSDRDMVEANLTRKMFM